MMGRPCQCFRCGCGDVVSRNCDIIGTEDNGFSGSLPNSNYFTRRAAEGATVIYGVTNGICSVLNQIGLLVLGHMPSSCDLRLPPTEDWRSIAAWVGNGGRLVMNGEFGPNCMSVAEMMLFNDMLSEIGATAQLLHNWTTVNDSTPPSATVTEAPFLYNPTPVPSLQIFAARFINPGSGTVLFRFNTEPIVVERVGLGAVLVTADSNTYSNGVVNSKELVDRFCSYPINEIIP